MYLWAIIILIASIVSAYLGYYRFTGFEADALKGAAVIGGIIFVIVATLGWKKS